MRMLFLVLAISLAGCGMADVKPTPTSTTPVVVKQSPAPSPKKGLSDAEYKRLTQDCKVPGVQEKPKPGPIEDIAVDTALARKAALEECNERMRKLRKAR